MDTTFWIAVIAIGVPLYAYAGYPILLFVFASFVQMGRDAYYLLSRRDRRQRASEIPFVSILLAAYNEETVIEATLSNLLGLDYPSDRFEVVVGSDASSDRTVEILRQYGDARVRVLDFQSRRGKLSVISDCADAARGDILVCSDANTLLRPNALRLLTRHFARPDVGAVCGELELTAADGGPAAEGIYWKYEKVLKMLESRLDSTLGANGAIYAIRKDLFPKLPPHLITDDFIIPMKARARNFRVCYDPEAVAVEEAPSGVHDEFKRRMRIGAGNWQALWQCTSLLLPTKGFVAFSFWSHKILRWATPFLLLPGLVANALLLEHRFWVVVFALQALFYLSAVLGFALGRLGVPAGPCRTVAYFLAINAALAIGLLKGVFGMQRATWQRTAREAASGERRV